MNKFYVENLEIELKNKLLDEVVLEISNIKNMVDNLLKNSHDTNLMNLQKIATIELKKTRKYCWEGIYESNENVAKVRKQCNELMNHFVGLKFTELNDAVDILGTTIKTFLWILKTKAEETIFTGKLVAIQKALNSFELQIKDYIESDIKNLNVIIAKGRDSEMIQ